MAKLEAAPEAREGDSNLDKLSRQLADKEKAKKQPQLVRVMNQSYLFGWKQWIYEGSWRPWEECWAQGKWKFVSWDLILDWTWDKGIFVKGEMILDWITLKITNWYYSGAPDKNHFSSLKWTAIATGGYKYDFNVDKNLNLTDITYNWVTLKLTRDKWGMNLISSKNVKLRIWWWNVSRDAAAVWVAYAISEVKNHNNALDEFEISPTGGAIQADYENETWDVNIINDCYEKTWIAPGTLVNWLNACRGDFKI